MATVSVCFPSRLPQPQDLSRFPRRTVAESCATGTLSVGCAVYLRPPSPASITVVSAPAREWLSRVRRSASSSITSSGSNVVVISATSESPQVAAKAANAYAQAFVDWRKERLQDLQISYGTATGNYRVLVPATVPTVPFAPNPCAAPSWGSASTCSPASAWPSCWSSSTRACAPRTRSPTRCAVPILGRIPDRQARARREHAGLADDIRSATPPRPSAWCAPTSTS